MAFIPVSAAGTTNSTTPVTILAGPSSGRNEVRSILVHNRDSVSHTLTITFTSSAVDYIIFKVTIDANDTFIQDIPVILTGTGQLLKAVLAGAATTQPTFLVTYAQAS